MSEQNPRFQHGPFPGERWGTYQVIAELTPTKKSRMFSVRCVCGCPSVVTRHRLLSAEDKPMMGCPACRGTNGLPTRTAFPPRWPDGIYGAWRLIERIPLDQDALTRHRDGRWAWRVVCRTCGKEKIEKRLREHRVVQDCGACVLRMRRRDRMVARATRRGATIIRMQLA